MLTLSFPLKLLLAMMLVVAGVTVATMYVTQQRVQAAYRDLFNQQFENQAFFFSELQEARLSSAREKCAALVKSKRLRAKYDEEHTEDVVGDCYSLAGDALTTLGIDPARVAIRLVDAKGAIMAAPTNFAPLGLDQQAASLARALKDADPQQILYLETKDGATNRMQEAVFTQIQAPDRDETIGALVLGFDLPDFSKADKRTHSQSALMISGNVHASGLSGEACAEISKTIQREPKALRNREPIPFDLGGASHLLFYRILNPNSAFPPAYQVTLFSLAEAIAQKRNLRIRILGSGAVALIGALILSLLLANGLTGPIKNLVAGTTEIRKGNFSVHLPVRSKDEIGRLTESFNTMAADLSLKEQYRTVLDMIADKQVAEELLQGKIALGGETREVSVLFCDIRGFTALTEKMAPPEVIKMLNEHFTPLTQIVHKHHGVVDKYVGDLIMAIFGAPKSFGQDAVHSARCALDMIEARHNLNQTSKYKIEVGIGVASGPALAGRMGSQDRLNYTVLGERVNLASRLCSKAGRMEIVIDQTTADKLGSSAVLQPLESLQLKGFAEAVPAFKLLQLTNQSA